MIVKWINPLTQTEDILHIERPQVDAKYWYSSNNCRTDTNVIAVLEDILHRLDCTREYDCGRPMMTTFLMYKSAMNDYYYYLLKFDNQITYNKYLDALIDRHVQNILFEYAHPYTPIKVTKKKRNNKKRIIPDKFVKQETIDMFTGEKKYFYTNPKTGEEYESSNPDFISELKQRKKKEKVPKRGAVPISAMTFDFKKKKNK